MVQALNNTWNVTPNLGKSKQTTKSQTITIFPTLVSEWCGLTFENNKKDSVPVPYVRKRSVPTDTVPEFKTKHLQGQKDVNGLLNGTIDADAVEVCGIKHYRYEVCSSDELVDIGNGKKLNKKCYEAFKKMQEAAAKENITIFIREAHRTVNDQKKLLQKRLKNKKNPTQAELKGILKYAAPPNYSEHHTGLAIDINTTTSPFGNSKAYQWLKKHAKEYGFEQSFPQDNQQHLGCEPWHWRYVGDAESAETFENARKNK